MIVVIVVIITNLFNIQFFDNWMIGRKIVPANFFSSQIHIFAWKSVREVVQQDNGFTSCTACSHSMDLFNGIVKSIRQSDTFLHWSGLMFWPFPDLNPLSDSPDIDVAVIIIIIIIICGKSRKLIV